MTPTTLRWSDSPLSSTQYPWLWASIYAVWFICLIYQPTWQPSITIPFKSSVIRSNFGQIKCALEAAFLIEWLPDRLVAGMTLMLTLTTRPCERATCDIEVRQTYTSCLVNPTELEPFRIWAVSYLRFGPFRFSGNFQNSIYFKIRNSKTPSLKFLVHSVSMIVCRKFMTWLEYLGTSLLDFFSSQRMMLSTQRNCL